MRYRLFLSVVLFSFLTINTSFLQQDFKKPAFNFSGLHRQNFQQPTALWVEKSLQEQVWKQELWQQSQECQDQQHRVKQHRQEKKRLQNGIRVERQRNCEQGKKIKHLGKRRKRVQQALSGIIARLELEKERLRSEKERLELENRELRDKNALLVKESNQKLLQPLTIARASIVSDSIVSDSIVLDRLFPISIVSANSAPARMPFDSKAIELAILAHDNATDSVDDGPPGW